MDSTKKRKNYCGFYSASIVICQGTEDLYDYLDGVVDEIERAIEDDKISKEYDRSNLEKSGMSSRTNEKDGGYNGGIDFQISSKLDDGSRSVRDGDTADSNYENGSSSNGSRGRRSDGNGLESSQLFDEKYNSTVNQLLQRETGGRGPLSHWIRRHPKFLQTWSADQKLVDKITSEKQLKAAGFKIRKAI